MTVLPAAGTPDPQDAFQQLQTLIQQWRDIGRVTTTAGLKPAMREAMGGFTEQQYGFETFRDFALAAEAAGWVHLERLPNGHTLLCLPNDSDKQEAPESGAGTTKTAEPNVTGVGLGDRTFRPDVWSVFIDWRDDVRRLWDRRARHAFMYPIDDDGRPAWETNAERFIDITPVTFGQQIAWMQEWVDTLPEPARQQLKASLSDTAPKGEFRRELARLGMASQWRTVLQQRMAEQIANWAMQTDVPVTHVIDNRTARTRSNTTTPAATVRSESLSPAVESSSNRRPATQRRQPTSINDLDRLRQRMHRAIDQMSLAELAALPVRAEHFLFDD
jgi:hypothetical protein